ncbi:MAG: hypothetical protein JWO53_75 [Chlamydiia bacterium]|nr:hypothetical protein [Chlamydiia bacterium]
MKVVARLKYSLLLMAFGVHTFAFGDNQTDTVSTILPETSLPFRVTIQQASFSLPNGIHSGISAMHNGKWLFLAGRTNGMHTFNNTTDNFPPSQQNQIVYVVDPVKKTIKARALSDSKSGLTQTQIDLLSVTSPQFYQSGKRVYMTGGYGVITATGEFSTKDVLTAIDVAGLMHWVTHPSKHETAAQHIRQISNPIFQVTGGYMDQIGKKPTLLVFGQNFAGFYFHAGVGVYTEQVRRFRIHDNGKKLKVSVKSSKPTVSNSSYRRRDLNVVPVMRKQHGKVVPSLVALSGVFTLTDGIWTVPVSISATGSTKMADPTLSTTFKQGMNNYHCAQFGMFSNKHGNMYSVLLGGISYGSFSTGSFVTDAEFPFTNEVTTIQINKKGQYQQFVMSGTYPTIISTQSNPGNQLLFGTGAYFMPAKGVDTYSNHVIKLDRLKKRKVVGYIVGGIQSTLPNTDVSSDSAASPYIFEVVVEPQ